MIFDQQVIGQANHVSRVISDPAPGADFVEVVPAGKIWLVLMCRSNLTTDGTPGNRLFRYNYDTVTNFVLMAAEVQVPGVAGAYYAHHLGVQQGVPGSSPVNDQLIRLPSVLLYGNNGDAFESQVANLQAGDQLNLIRFDYLEFNDKNK